MKEHDTPSDTTIIGYRPLAPHEIVLVNRIKLHGQRLGELLADLELHLKTQAGEADGPEHMRLEQTQPARWLALGRTRLQEGLMDLTRAVAQPSSF
jgi:hypothetical protein